MRNPTSLGTPKEKEQQQKVVWMAFHGMSSPHNFKMKFREHTGASQKNNHVEDLGTIAVST